MKRYAIIHEKMPREFVLLQGTGCRWKKCRFCDYHTDISDAPININQKVLKNVTGIYGVLDIINSGSALELDCNTIQLIKDTVIEKHIHTLWFESHYMYRFRLHDFAKQFYPATTKFRCGVETFNPELRQLWNKGIGNDVTANDIAKYFNGVCLLCGTDIETKDHIISDIETALAHFEYASINLFCDNSTDVHRNYDIAKWVENEVYPRYKDNPRLEFLINNTDLGVG